MTDSDKDDMDREFDDNYSETSDMDEFEADLDTELAEEALDVTHETDQDAYGDDLDDLPDPAELEEEQEIVLADGNDFADQEQELNEDVGEKKPNPLPFIAAGVVALGVGVYVILGPYLGLRGGSTSVPAPAMSAFEQPAPQAAQLSAPTPIDQGEANLAPARPDFAALDSAPVEPQTRTPNAASEDVIAPVSLGRNVSQEAPTSLFDAELAQSSGTVELQPVHTPEQIRPSRTAAQPREALRQLDDGAIPGMDALVQAVSSAVAQELASHRAEMMTQLKKQLGEPLTVDRGAEYQEVLQRLDDLGLVLQRLPEATKARAATAGVRARTTDTDADLAALTTGRERLKGFKVINATPDGTMSVVETPSGRVNVYFKGEKFYLHGKLVSVTGIEANGQVVLVENNGFIDSTYVPRPKPAVAAKTPKSSGSVAMAATPKVVKPGTTSAEALPVTEHPPVRPVAAAPTTRPLGQESEPAPSSTVISHSPVSAAEQRYNPIKGWGFHGILDDGFLLHSPDDKWPIYRKGDLLPGVGIIAGLDQNNNLRVGDYSIPLAR